MASTDRVQDEMTLVPARQGNSARVLVVEDNAMIALYLGEIVEDMGHKVCATACTEAGAVAAAFESRPDLIIIDAWLDHGSGAAAVARIIGKGFVPHIFVACDARNDGPLHPRSIVVQKPFVEADIARAVDRALDGSTAH